VKSGNQGTRNERAGWYFLAPFVPFCHPLLKRPKMDKRCQRASPNLKFFTVPRTLPGRPLFFTTPCPNYCKCLIEHQEFYRFFTTFTLFAGLGSGETWPVRYLTEFEGNCCKSLIEDPKLTFSDRQRAYFFWSVSKTERKTGESRRNKGAKETRITRMPGRRGRLRPGSARRWTVYTHRHVKDRPRTAPAPILSSVTPLSWSALASAPPCPTESGQAGAKPLKTQSTPPHVTFLSHVPQIFHTSVANFFSKIGWVKNERKIQTGLKPRQSRNKVKTEK